MIPKVQPFDCYKAYLGLKNHFTKPNYDYQRYCGKSRASIQSFYKRKDRYFFEKLSRQKDDTEVIEFFVSNFADCDDPGSPPLEKEADIIPISPVCSCEEPTIPAISLSFMKVGRMPERDSFRRNAIISLSTKENMTSPLASKNSNLKNTSPYLCRQPTKILK